jgi:hypothetical protein
MIDVMYDLSILDAIKYQNPASLETYKINPSQYIYKSIKLTAHNLHKAISIMLLTIRTTKKCMMRLSNESMQKIILDSLVAREDKKQAVIKADS